VQALNQGLEAKVRDQVEELERVGRLRRFLAPQLAQAIVSAGDETVLENHRREIVACSATCAASLPSPRPPSPRTSWRCWPSITAR
jgi:hypothetical protein